MKTVIITGMAGGYPHPPQGAEVWGVNQSYLLQRGLTRLYAMGPAGKVIGEKGFPNFVHAVNSLRIPVVLQEPHPDIPRSEAYPYQAVADRFFNGVPERVYCAGGTISWMLADAILKGMGTIILWRVLSNAGAEDYFEQKACFDFWAGVALGAGVGIGTSDDSLVMKPYPWQQPRYGLGPEDSRAHGLVSSAIREIIGES